MRSLPAPCGRALRLVRLGIPHFSHTIYAASVRTSRVPLRAHRPCPVVRSRCGRARCPHRAAAPRRDARLGHPAIFACPVVVRTRCAPLPCAPLVRRGDRARWSAAGPPGSRRRAASHAVAHRRAIPPLHPRGAHPTPKNLCAPIHPAQKLFVPLCVKNFAPYRYYVCVVRTAITPAKFARPRGTRHHPRPLPTLPAPVKPFRRKRTNCQLSIDI